jgi:TPR repeat protein
MRDIIHLACDEQESKMKKIVIAFLLLAGLAYAGALENGVKAYEYGNYKEAAKWYKKAADQGFALAQYNLGVMYVKGLGVRQNYKEAVKWFKKAADQGHASAQNNLGVMYVKGQGVRQDKSKAKMLFGQACNNGLQLGCDYYRILNEQGVQ